MAKAKRRYGFSSAYLQNLNIFTSPLALIVLESLQTQFQTDCALCSQFSTFSISRTLPIHANEPGYFFKRSRPSVWEKGSSTPLGSFGNQTLFNFAKRL